MSDNEDGCVAPVAPAEEKIRFPKVEGPSSFFDDESHVAWVAVPFDKIYDPNFAVACLDRAKYDILNFLGKYIQDRTRREALASKSKTKTGIFAKLGI